MDILPALILFAAFAIIVIGIMEPPDTSDLRNKPHLLPPVPPGALDRWEPGREPLPWGGPQRASPYSPLDVIGSERNLADEMPEHRHNGLTQPCGPDCNHLLPPQGEDKL